MTKLAPEWVRTSDPVIRSPAGYRWTTAPASARRLEYKHTYIHNTYVYACIHTYIALPVLSARRYIHPFTIRAYLASDSSTAHMAPISAPIRDRRAEWRADWSTKTHTYIIHTYMHVFIHIEYSQYNRRVDIYIHSQYVHI